MLVVQRHERGDRVEAVGVHERPHRQAASVRPRFTEPGSLSPTRRTPERASTARWSKPTAAVTEGRGRVEEGIGAHGQHRFPSGQVAGGDHLGRAGQVGVVVDDGRPGLDAGQRIRGDLLGRPWHVGVDVLGRSPVDRCLDDDRPPLHATTVGGSLRAHRRRPRRRRGHDPSVGRLRHDSEGKRTRPTRGEGRSRERAVRGGIGTCASVELTSEGDPIQRGSALLTFIVNESTRFVQQFMAIPAIMQSDGPAPTQRRAGRGRARQLLCRRPLAAHRPVQRLDPRGPTRTRAGGHPHRPVHRPGHRRGRGGRRPGPPHPVRARRAHRRRRVGARPRLGSRTRRRHRHHRPLVGAPPGRGDGGELPPGPGDRVRRHHLVTAAPAGLGEHRPGCAHPPRRRPRPALRTALRRRPPPRHPTRAPAGRPGSHHPRRPRRRAAAARASGHAVSRDARNPHPERGLSAPGPGRGGRNPPHGLARLPGLRRRHPARQRHTGLARRRLAPDPRRRPSRPVGRPHHQAPRAALLPRPGPQGRPARPCRRRHPPSTRHPPHDRGPARHPSR